jgi:hypothetical protein
MHRQRLLILVSVATLAVVVAVAPTGGAGTARRDVHTAGPTYTMRVVNHGRDKGTFVLFQEAPDPSFQPVAWRVLPTPQNGDSTAQWQVNYQLWAANDDREVKPGTVVQASTSVNVDPGTGSTATVELRGPEVSLDLGSDGPPGTITLLEGASIPLRGVVDGFSMDGKIVFARNAQPNLQINVPIDGAYYVAFVRDDVREGAVLDRGAVLNNSVAIRYPANVKSSTVTVDANNRLSVQFGGAKGP